MCPVDVTIIRPAHKFCVCFHSIILGCSSFLLGIPPKIMAVMYDFPLVVDQYKCAKLEYKQKLLIDQVKLINEKYPLC